MEIANAMVRLAGDIRHQVYKRNVTPGEVAILREVHGGTAVTDITVVGKQEDANEFDRLIGIYGEAKVTGLWPGYNPNLPETFEEIGMEVEIETPTKPAGRKKKAVKKKKAAAKPVSDDTDENMLD